MNTDLANTAEATLAVIKAVKGMPARTGVNTVLFVAFLICDRYGLNKTKAVYDALGTYEMAKEIVEKEED